jgi:predicted NAD/FAD-binding protein
MICEYTSSYISYSLNNFPPFKYGSLTNPVPRKKIAVIGSGSAGIAALWALNRTHHDVYIYEAADRLGGHTNTVEFKHGKSKTLVDTGFIVLNSATYRMYSLRLRNCGS